MTYLQPLWALILYTTTTSIPADNTLHYVTTDDDADDGNGNENVNHGNDDDNDYNYDGNGPEENGNGKERRWWYWQWKRIIKLDKIYLNMLEIFIKCNIFIVFVVRS